MKLSSILPLVLIASCALPFVGVAQEKAPDGAKKVAKAPIPENVKAGYELIYAGKIEEALAAFKKIRAEEPENKWATKAIRPLTQAVQLEKIVAMDKHVKWMSAANWLNTFYTRNKVPTKALALAERAFTRFPDDKDWGNRYAMALADANQGKKAVTVYEALLVKHPAADIRVMAAITYAKQGNTEKAMMHLGKLPEKITDPGLTYNLACAYALMGKVPEAGRLLAISFELTPPSKLDARKKHAKVDADLAKLTGSKELVVAMNATSKVTEKAPAAGCGDCPSSEGCSEEEKEACGEEEKEGCSEEEAKKKAAKKGPVKN
jgi:tetratricopeptide (TPR) repeat protein